ncbi:alpha/beta hydrolase fold-3 domain-containing protein [Hypoxylon argillaceum]|nr:alpha/beta hydrolase fold-3 domain-containing protein [Hypoxylon argillaceum]
MASSINHPLLSYQPLRLLFQLSYTTTIILRLPYYALVALVPFLRPNPRWSAKQTFMTHLFYPILDLTSRVGITETLTLEKGKEGDNFQTISPSDLDVYKGPLVSEVVKPATIGGTWFPHAPADVAGKTIVLYFHGGGFIQGDGRTANCGPLAKRLLNKGGADAVFSVQYRLSGYGGINPFPAALQDAVSSYLFILNEVKVPASQIVVGGDSAGANLTTALLRYLQEFGAAINVPVPKCAILLSPWVAPFQHDTKNSPQRKTDFVPYTYPQWGSRAYTQGLSDAASNTYITPLGNPFATPVPLFINIASAELLYEQVQQWAGEMRGISGNVVELYHELDAVHDTLLVAGLLGFEKSAADVALEIGKFVRRY